MSRTKRIGEMRTYSSGASIGLGPTSTRKIVAMSLVNSSVIMLLTARSLQIALNRSPWQPANQVAMKPP